VSAVEATNAAHRGTHLDRVSITGAALLEDDLEDAGMIAGVADRGEVALMPGEEKVALKTWLALDAAIAALVGGEWLGCRVEPQEDDVLVWTETSFREIKKRLRMLCKGRGMRLADIAHRIVLVNERVTLLAREELERRRFHAVVAAKRTEDMAGPKRSTLSQAKAGDYALSTGSSNAFALLDAYERPWAVAIFDTARFCMDGDENSSEAAMRFTAGAKSFAGRTGAFVLIPHHTRKGTDGVDVRSSRGSGELTGGVDAILNIAATKAKRTMHFTLRNRLEPLPISYELEVDGDSARIVVVEAAEDLSAQVLAFLKGANSPMNATAIRKEVNCSGKTVSKALSRLKAERKVSATGTEEKKLWSYNPSFEELLK
jgi:hypothetical protein